MDGDKWVWDMYTGEALQDTPRNARLMATGDCDDKAQVSHRPDPELDLQHRRPHATTRTKIEAEVHRTTKS